MEIIQITDLHITKDIENIKNNCKTYPDLINQTYLFQAPPLVIAPSIRTCVLSVAALRGSQRTYTALRMTIPPHLQAGAAFLRE